MAKRHTNRDRFEHYLATMLLGTRPIQMIGGLLLLIYGIAALFSYPISGVVALVMAVALLLMVYSDHFVILVARAGAWLATINH